MVFEKIFKYTYNQKKVSTQRALFAITERSKQLLNAQLFIFFLNNKKNVLIFFLTILHTNNIPSAFYPHATKNPPSLEYTYICIFIFPATKLTRMPKADINYPTVIIHLCKMQLKCNSKSSPKIKLALNVSKQCGNNESGAQQRPQRNSH